MKLLRGMLVLVLVACGAYSIGVAQGKAVNMPAATLKWVPAAPGSPMQMVNLWGDQTKGDYGMLLKMPAGMVAGRHTHTADYHALGVQGTWVHTNDGGKPIELGPGSYVMQPGKQVHDDSCKGPGECVIFVHQHAPRDFMPAKP